MNNLVLKPGARCTLQVCLNPHAISVARWRVCGQPAVSVRAGHYGEPVRECQEHLAKRLKREEWKS